MLRKCIVASCSYFWHPNSFDGSCLTIPKDLRLHLLLRCCFSQLDVCGVVVFFFFFCGFWIKVGPDCIRGTFSNAPHALDSTCGLSQFELYLQHVNVTEHVFPCDKGLKLLLLKNWDFFFFFFLKRQPYRVIVGLLIFVTKGFEGKRMNVAVVLNPALFVSIGFKFNVLFFLMDGCHAWHGPFSTSQIGTFFSLKSHLNEFKSFTHKWTHSDWV